MHGYPKVYALGHREVKDIFDSEVLIQEKIDGSQISFGMLDGELKIKSKSKELIIEQPEKMFTKAVNYIVSIKDQLQPNWTYRGEYLNAPKHNALAYDRIPKNHIMIFDINTGHEQYLNYLLMEAECLRLNLEMVPVFSCGVVLDPLHLPDIIRHVSCLGGNNMEGIVVKNYNMFGADKKVLMAKFVSETFKEVHRQNWKIGNPNKSDVLELLIDSLRTDARFAKAVQHLRERGELDTSLRDIPNLMREMDADLKAECSDYVIEKLTDWAWPKILRGVKRGLPEWYKKYLIEQAYGNEQ